MGVSGRLAAVACAALVGAVTGGAAEARRITFTTRSPEARAAVAEAVRAIESFAGAQVQPLAKKAVEADPGFAFAHYLVGVSGPAAQARPHLDKALELAKGASEAERRYLEAAILNRNDKPEEAAAALARLLADYPDERMAHMLLGQIHMNRGRPAEARASFEKALALDASTPRVHLFLGNVAVVQGDYAKARELYAAARERRAPGTNPGNLAFSTAITHLYEGQPDKALATLREFLDEYRKSPPGPLPEVFIWNAMARINLEHGRLKEALEAYEKGFESVPGSALPKDQKKVWEGRLHHGRGRALARMGRHEEAWKEAETVRRMIEAGGEEGKEFLPAYHYLAGYVKLEAGQAAAAIEHLRQADQEDPFIKLLLARAYEKAGDKESARRSYREVLASRQNSLDRALAYPEAKRRLASL